MTAGVHRVKRTALQSLICRRAASSNSHYYRAMHFSAKRGIAITCRLSVRPSVCNVGGL